MNQRSLLLWGLVAALGLWFSAAPACADPGPSPMLVGGAVSLSRTVSPSTDLPLSALDDLASMGAVQPGGEESKVVPRFCLDANRSAMDWVQELQATLVTGALLFSEGDCLAVKVFSRSRWTHVAAVVRDGNEIWVYDSMPSSGVRRSRLIDYLNEMAPSELTVLQPARTMSSAEAAQWSAELQRQLGTPYAIRHHLTGQRGAGVHCSEYVTDALIASGWMTARQPPRVSPGSLWQGATQTGLFVSLCSAELDTISTPPPAQESWCQWACRETGECCTATCQQMSRWFLCRSK
jgi:hypothetical protein